MFRNLVRLYQYVKIILKQLFLSKKIYNCKTTGRSLYCEEVANDGANDEKYYGKLAIS